MAIITVEVTREWSKCLMFGNYSGNVRNEIGLGNIGKETRKDCQLLLATIVLRTKTK